MTLARAGTGGVERLLSTKSKVWIQSSRDIQKTGLIASSQRWRLRFRNLGRIVRILSSLFSGNYSAPMRGVSDNSLQCKNFPI